MTLCVRQVISISTARYRVSVNSFFSVASAIIFFSVGDHVVDVAFPKLRAVAVHRHRNARSDR
jgi:hypothetical protein